MKNSTEMSKRKETVLIILLLGSLFGLSEVFISQMIIASNLPLRASMLTGIGMLLMGVSLVMLNRVSLFPIMAAIAVLMKMMIVPIAGITFLCKANSSIAVLFEASALSLAVSYIGTQRKGSAAFSGLTAGISSAIIFYFVGLHVAPCNYLKSFAGTAGFVSYLYREALMWGVFSAALFPAGLMIGRSIKNSEIMKLNTRPAGYYYSVSSVIIVCWIISAVTIYMTV